MTPWFLALCGGIWLALVAWLRRREARSGRGWDSSADVLAGGLLFLLVLGFFWRTLSGDVYQPADGGDLVSFLYPTYRFAAGELAAGRLPLWNPTLYGGAPFVGDIQAGFFYPPNLALFLARPDFPYSTLQWMSVLHLYWAGLGMYVLVRSLRFGARRVHALAALFAAIAFAFSDPLLIHIGNLNLIAVLSWLPWILAAFNRALGQGSLRWAAIAGLLFGVSIYAGHAQSTLYIALALILYAVFSLAAEWRSIVDSARTWRSPANAAILTVITCGLAATLAAPVLLPAAELAGLSARSDFVYQDTVSYSLAPTQMIGMVAPGFFGRGPALHWSLWDRVELPYVGVVTILMALAGLLLADAAARRKLLPWLGLAAAGLLVGFGIYMVVHGWLTVVTPFFGELRAPARSLVLWSLGVSVISAVGVDAIIRAAAFATLSPGVAPADIAQGWTTLRAIMRSGTLILFGVVLPLSFLSLLLTQDNETTFVRASIAAIALSLAACFWLGTWSLSEAARSGWFGSVATGALLVGLLFLELSATGAYTDISPDDPTRAYAQDEIVAYLRAEPEPFRIDSRTDIEAFWQPDTAALYGLEDVGGIANPLTLQAWDQTWNGLAGRDDANYQALNAKYLIAPDGTQLPDNFELALDAAGELSLFRNTAAWPRAWLAQAGDAPPDDSLGSVAVESRTANQLTVRVDATRPAWLVLSEMSYPARQLFVDGVPVPTSANGWGPSVQLGAGQHIVQYRYQATPFRSGVWLAIAALTLSLALALFGARWHLQVFAGE